MVLPRQGNRARVAAVPAIGVAQVLHHCVGLAHLHRHAPQVSSRVVPQPPLARLLAHNQRPVVRVTDVHKQRVRPRRNHQVADHHVPVRLQRGGRICPRTPNRVGLLRLRNQPVLGEDLALARPSRQASYS